MMPWLKPQIIHGDETMSQKPLKIYTSKSIRFIFIIHINYLIFFEIVSICI